MESASSPARAVRPIDAALLATAAQRAAAEVRGDAEPAKAIAAAVDALYEAVGGLLPSVFVLEHGRLWLVAQRGYAVVPDGITIETGITGRAIRLGRAQLAPDVVQDPDYFPALPGVVAELAVPLRAGRELVGVLNVEAERELPAGAEEAVRPLVLALSPLVERLRATRTLDLAALARLFVHLGSLRSPDEIAALGAASLAKVLPVEVSHLLHWDDVGAPVELAAWRSQGANARPLSPDEIEGARKVVDPTVVCHVLDPRATGSEPGRTVVWLPLRANAQELGALVGISRSVERVDPSLLDTAAVLAAHVAASLDAALALTRERRSAATDPLTGVLNRRGFEERLEQQLAAASQDRVPLSLLVLDCDDFKEVNDRAGHEFGDSLLREVADVLSRSLPVGAEAARLGGDEFVVMLPGTGVEAAEALGRAIGLSLAEGLSDAGFPLRMSGGISTFPFDGARPSALLRAADQALYAAKTSGKNRVASFRSLAGTAPAIAGRDRPSAQEPHRRGRGGGPGQVLSDALAAVEAIEAEHTVKGICERLCKALVFVVGATACQASQVVGDLLVDATEHALREVSLGSHTAYRIADFPLTEEVLRTGEPRAVSFADGDVDSAEAFILRGLGMNALLMLPIVVRGRPFGLVELYEMRLRSFGEDDVAVARFLTRQAERRLEALAPNDGPDRLPGIYELPVDDGPSGPRTR